MFDLFRFIALRPPQKADESQTVALAAPSQFQTELAIARAGEAPRAVMKNIADAYVAGAFSVAFVKDVSSLVLYNQLRALDTQIKQAGDLNLTSLCHLITETFKIEANALVSNKDFLSDKERVFDSIITIMITASAQVSTIDDLIRFARLFALIGRVAGGDTTLDQAGALKEALQRTVLLPAPLFPLPLPLEGVERTQGTNQNAQHALEAIAARTELASKVANIKSTIESLMAMDAGDFTEPPATITVPLTGSPQDPSDRALLFQRTTDGPEGTAGRALLFQHSPDQPIAIRRPVGGFFTLKAESIENLDSTAKAVLADAKIDLSSTSLPVAVNRLQHELSKTTRMMNEPQTLPKGQNVLKVGSALAAVPNTISIVESPQPMTPEDVIIVPPVTLPRATIKSIGMGDLLVVKQRLKCYEAGEISYIENILKGESSKRATRRTRTTEETFLTETETTKEEERDLQATERFELKQETDTTIKEDTSVKAGVAISASYGPMLEVKSNLDVKIDNSKEVATKQATNYSKDVTNRAASKVTERVRKQQTLKIVEQYEETNEHGVDNTTGTGHVIGIYQWVDKIYQAQVFNYGQRVLFDVMIPEPAAFLIDALSVHQSAGQALVPPDPFDIAPDQLNESNYLQYVHKYSVTGVEQPSPEFLYVSKTFKAEKGQGKDGDKQPRTLNDATEVPIPDGYQASYAWTEVEYLLQGNTIMILVVGQYVIVYDGKVPLLDGTNGQLYLPKLAETQSLPITILTRDIESYTIAIEIYCQRTERACIQWRIKTHDAIMMAYIKLKGDYEDKLAALAVQQQGVQFPGRNPDENRALVQTELKKACLSLLTNTHVDWLGAVQDRWIITGEDDPNKKYPQLDLLQAEVQGNYIRFFEQAFEWEQMMYFFYPYFWGRKANWYERVLMEDTDPMFADFLKAGAARVVFPVRHGFEIPIANFLDTGQILDFGEVDIHSPYYLLITQEIKESEHAPGLETPQGDPWDVRLPTTLVKLRQSASLPKWKPDPNDPNGEWIPDEQ